MILIFAVFYVKHYRNIEKSAYVGQETRKIKALSAQEIDDYLNGRGLGYAKAAELNHYPGPRHVLELADKIALNEKQKQRTETVFADMQKQAVGLGLEFIEKEDKINKLFANSQATQQEIQALLMQIGALEAKIRYTHLSAHIDQRAILTPQQIVQYDELRGYGDRGINHSHNGH